METGKLNLEYTKAVMDLNREIDRLRAELAECEELIEAQTAEILVLHDIRDQLEQCQEECAEQARLNGMGSEREAQLMAERNEWIKRASMYRSHMNIYAQSSFIAAHPEAATWFSAKGKAK